MDGMSGTNSEVGGFSRRFGKIQDSGRISIPKPFRESLDWREDDQVMIEIHRDRYILVENLSAKWRKGG